MAPLATPPRPSDPHTTVPALVAALHAQGAAVQPSVIETHISWVVLTGDRAYKLKKPLVLDFLDYGTPARRREMCRAEVALNRRLAADLYLGVRGVAVGDSGARLTGDEDPEALDYVVEMRRYDPADSLAARLERGELQRSHVREVGAALARFHAQARVVACSGPPVLAAERMFERNLHELLAHVDQRAEVARVQALERFAHAYLVRHARLFAQRARGGHIREGHGDLRAEHVLVHGAVRVVDGVEFDPGLRELDVADDLAFLVFDLAARGGERFGRELVAAYRAAGGDPGPDDLIAFYATYRALVRAKVALVRAGQLPAGAAAQGHQSAQARDLIGVAERFAWQARLPLTLVVCGVPASGKSHLASALAAQSGLPVLNSDLVRKQLAGIPATQHAAATLYTPAFNARTYTELGARAARYPGAIVDATCRRRSDREAFAAGLGAGRECVFIQCLAPRAVLMARARQREDDPASVSDAGAAVVARESEVWEALDEVAAHSHLLLRTDRPAEELVEAVLSGLDGRLAAARPRRSTRRSRREPRSGGSDRAAPAR